MPQWGIAMVAAGDWRPRFQIDLLDAVNGKRPQPAMSRARAAAQKAVALSEAPGKAPGGYIPFVEPIDEVVARMDAAIRTIAVTAGPGGRVAAVSHAGAISFYLAHLLQLDSGPLRVLPQFTSVSVILIKDDRIVVQSIGDVGHLAGDPGAG